MPVRTLLAGLKSARQNMALTDQTAAFQEMHLLTWKRPQDAPTSSATMAISSLPRNDLALITHGLPRRSAEVPLMRPQTYTSPAIGFAQRGFAAVT